MERVQQIATRMPIVNSIAFRPAQDQQPSRLSAMLVDKSIKLWDVETGYEAITLPAENGIAFSWSPDGNQIVIGANTGICQILHSSPDNDKEPDREGDQPRE